MTLMTLVKHVAGILPPGGARPLDEPLTTVTNREALSVRAPKPAAQRKTRGRLEFLDSLRGWAAVYVLLYHTALIPSPALTVPKWAAPAVLNGGTGVTLFFIVSAFSLCLSARPGESHGTAWTAFMLRRFFRIAPLFYLILLVSLVRDVLLFGAWHSPAMIAVNAAFLFNFWPGQETGIVWASWTIGVEMPFYALFPFLMTRTRTIAAAIALTLGFLIVEMVWPGDEILHLAGVSAAVSSSYRNFELFRYLPVFASGILIYQVFTRFIENAPRRPSVGWGLLLGSLYLYASLLRGNVGVGVVYDAYYWQIVVFGLLILGLAIQPNIIVVNSITRYVGKISYSVYLIHTTVIYLLIPVFRSIEGLGWSPTGSFGACAVLTLGLTLLLSTMAYHLVERPGIRLGRRLISRLAPSGRPSLPRPA